MRLFIFGMLLAAGTVACGGEEEPAAEPTKAEKVEEKKEAKADKVEEKAEAAPAAPAKAKGGKAKGGN